MSTKTKTEAPEVRILKDARALLARRGGWIKGDFDREVKPGFVAHCAIGAIERVSEGEFAALRSAEFALVDEVSPYISITEWNDAPGRKKSEVLAAFDRAIRLARRRVRRARKGGK